MTVAVRRTRVASFAVLIVALAALAALLPASASAQGKKAPVKLSVLTKSEGSALDAKAVRVRITARRKITFRLAVTIRSLGSSKYRKGMTKSRKIRFKKAGRKTVKLKLNAAGRRYLRRCGRASVRVSTRVRFKGKRRTVRAGRRLRGKACATGPGPIVNPPTPRPQPKPQPGPLHVDAPNADRCDPIGAGHCLYPYPNDYFTRADATTDTGRRLNLKRDSMPATNGGTRINPADWNKNDGFSPGQQITLKVPGLDNQAAFNQTGLVPITDVGESFTGNQPLVVINAETKQRQLIWAELDSQATSDAQRALLIHPAKNFEENTRYIVALRRPKTSTGQVIQPTTAFRALRDKIPTDSKAVEDRRPAMEAIFKTLGDAGIGRGDLYIAWDFTTASERNLSERMLKIRDDAFAKLGDTNLSDLTIQGDTPDFTVTSTQDLTEEQDPEIQRIVSGTVQVPCYLQADGCPAGSRFNLGPDGLPAQKPGNVYNAPFRCVIPRTIPAERTRALIYGHGLLGSPMDSGSSAQDQLKTLAQQKGFTVCGTYMIGLSSAPAGPGQNQDIQQAAAAIQDFSTFETIIDRLQQGVLNHLYLGRAMIHPDGFGDDAAFQVGDETVFRAYPAGQPSLFYDGNSQGGIMGGMVTAYGPDHTRGVLGVPGMNMPFLIQRSTDFAPFLQILNATYKNELERPLIYSLLNNIWDRGDPNGVAWHMTSDPLPNTPAHQVLLHVALGDHQVAPVSTLVEARTIGAKVHTPVYDAGRTTEVEPAFGIDPIIYPFEGSGLYMYDGGPKDFVGTTRNPQNLPNGTDPPPDANVPPGDAQGKDPHEFPRRTQSSREMKDQFLRPNGRVETDPCGGDVCYANGWTGP